MTYSIYEWTESTGVTYWVPECTEGQLRPLAQLIQDTVPEDVSKMDLVISARDEDGNRQIQNFNSWCRRNKVFSPAQREGQAAFRASFQRVKAMGL